MRVSHPAFRNAVDGAVGGECVTVTMETHVGACIDINFETGEVKHNLESDEHALMLADAIFPAWIGETLSKR